MEELEAEMQEVISILKISGDLSQMRLFGVSQMLKVFAQADDFKEIFQNYIDSQQSGTDYYKDLNSGLVDDVSISSIF